jgi:tetratricopeptide (TPR) repeat protein
MSKPMAVTVPMLLLLLDWWPLQRFGRVPLQTILLEKAPLFFLSGASCIITLSAQQSGGAVIAVEKLSALERLTNALSSYAIYLWQTLWPQDLALLYPLPPAPPLRTAAFGTVIIILVSTFAFVHRKDRPYLLTGWFWYLGMLLPVIGLVQVGVQSHADRYSYLPMVGCSIAAVWQLHEISANRRLRRALILLTVGTLFMLAFLTRQQTMIWHDSETLFRHAIAITDNNYVMHMNLGIALWERNEQDGAIAEYRKAISICPQYAPQHFILANALLVQGNAEEAADEYRTTLKLHPDYSYAHTNLGMALQKSGHIEEAIAEYEEGIRLLPEDYKAAENLQFLRSKKR